MATYKMCSLEGAWEDQQPHFLFLFRYSLYISETNGARKLKFSVVVGLYRY